MKSFADVQTEDRRLAILRLLAESTDYRANLYLLQTALESFGHNVSHDRLHADLDWLYEQGLVTVAGLAGITLARLTERGADVAAGRAIVTGVKRPGP